MFDCGKIFKQFFVRQHHDIISRYRIAYKIYNQTTIIGCYLKLCRIYFLQFTEARNTHIGPIGSNFIIFTQQVILRYFNIFMDHQVDKNTLKNCNVTFYEFAATRRNKCKILWQHKTHTFVCCSNYRVCISSKLVSFIDVVYWQ